MEGPIWGTDGGTSSEEHESRQGTGAIRGHKNAGATGEKELFQVCKSIEQEGAVLEQWAKSYTIPVYKGKGDVLVVGKYRGVKLPEQDMKVYEKTLEKRLRDIVKIDEQ